jgi:metal-responsive CopG/Arc/MetJ family transcriptional regulator
MPQFTFTINKTEEDLLAFIDELSEKEGRSRSSMIVLLLQQAVKEKLRKRNAKQNNT